MTRTANQRWSRTAGLDESIQRMRYRNGYDKPLVWMEPGKVAEVTFQPLTTGNFFGVDIGFGWR